MAMTITDTARIETLTTRLTKGLDMLMAREHAGRLDATYDNWLKGWTDLLAEYVSLEPS